MGATTNLSIEPLVAVAEQIVNSGDSDEAVTLTNDLFATLTGYSTRTIIRWRQAGELPWTRADEAAVHMGLHPLLIWGDEWSELDAEYVAAEIEKEAQRTVDAVAS